MNNYSKELEYYEKIFNQLKPQIKLINDLRRTILTQQLETIRTLQNTFPIEIVNNLQKTYSVIEDYNLAHRKQLENIKEIYKNSLFIQLWGKNDSTISNEDIEEFRENLDEFQQELETNPNPQVNIILQNAKQYPELENIEAKDIEKSISFLLISSASTDKTISDQAKVVLKFLFELPQNKNAAIIGWYLGIISSIITIYSFVQG